MGENLFVMLDFKEKLSVTCGWNSKAKFSPRVTWRIKTLLLISVIAERLGKYRNRRTGHSIGEICVPLSARF